MDMFMQIHQFNVFCVHHPTQKGIADYLQEPKHYLRLSEFYQKKRDLFVSEIQSAKGRSNFEIKKCEGTYFQLLDYSKVSDLPDMQFAEYLTKDIGVAVIPLSPFYEKKESQPIIRICFAKTDEVLKKAAKKLTAL